jgi:hypothetical protein
MKTRTCTKCKNEIELSNFRVSNNKWKSINSRCNQCENKRQQEWRDKNRNKHRKYDRELKQLYKTKYPFQTRLHNIRRSAIQHARNLNNLPMKITKAFIEELYNKQDGKCYYTGLKMKIQSELNKDLMIMSLDRIDSSKGYVEDNVVLCCWGINLLKGQHSVSELFKNLCLFYEGAKLNEQLKATSHGRTTVACCAAGVGNITQ